MLKIFAKIPYLITDDSYGKLKQYDPNSRKKISILGWFAIIPSIMWFLSTFLMCHNLLETSVTAAIISATIASIIIFIFERSIVQSTKNHWLLFILRISMGICVALISSVCLDLVIFKNDIDAFARVKMIQEMENKVSEARNNYSESRNVFFQELDGAGGSKMKGFGKIAAKKEAQMNEEKTKLDKIETMLDSTKQEINNNPNVKRLNSALGLNTILNRVRLLHEFVIQDKFALVMWSILLAVGFFLEVFGLFTKCCSPKSAYEKDVQVLEHLMANKRKIIIEQSDYYSQIGIPGREALDGISFKAPTFLN